MISVKIAAFLSFPFYNAYFLVITNTEVSSSLEQETSDWFIRVVLITFTIDQILGVLGFMAFEINGFNIDTNFGLGLENPFNPIVRIQTWNSSGNGNKRRFISEIVQITVIILAIICGIASISSF